MLFQSRPDFVREYADKDARHSLMEATIRTNVAMQIRSLRGEGLTQEALAERLKTKKGAISRMENPSYGKMAIPTLFQLCRALDVGISITFKPFSKVYEEIDSISPDTFKIPKYDSQIEQDRIGAWAAGEGAASQDRAVAVSVGDDDTAAGLGAFHRFLLSSDVGGVRHRRQYGQSKDTSPQNGSNGPRVNGTEGKIIGPTVQQGTTA